MNLIVFKLRQRVEHVVPCHHGGDGHDADGGANRPPHHWLLVVNRLEPPLERRVKVAANHAMDPYVSVEAGSEVKPAGEHARR